MITPAPRLTLATLGLLSIITLAKCGGSPDVSTPAGDLHGDSSAGGTPSAANGGMTSILQTEMGDAGMAPSGGCSGQCEMEGMALCGDGVVGTAEQCDDGNATPGDGCSGVCQIEPGYTCAEPAQACVYAVPQACGNGKIEGNEACDDGNAQNGDGCTSACAVEQGYACITPGDACVPKATAVCGDGQVDGAEECDDGQMPPANGDG